MVLIDCLFVVTGMWSERWGGHSDSKPLGPQAISMDAKFLGASHVYGIPEHATSMSLKSTIHGTEYNEPYRVRISYYSSLL